MDCCDILCGIFTCCSLCTLCEPTVCHCCGKKDYDLDEPIPAEPQLVEDQPHHTNEMLVRGQFAVNGQDADDGVRQYQGAKPKPY